MNVFAYVYKDGLYLNITNRCMMACPYCMKNKWKNDFRGNDLRLEREPTAKETVEAIENNGGAKKYKEIIFCGYGDALARLETVKEVASWIKGQGCKTRLNTAGLANRFYGRNILPELEGHIDAISISLNGTNPKEHDEINKPMFGKESFEEILKFVSEAKKYIPSVTITAVGFDFLDVSKVEQIAKTLGVNFRQRKYEE
ncbi:MAG: TatD family nuclease-associated radical SAM protein [Elusimicrobiota bacterium]|nr:TatD family nuclease-associated radical SAM protein [Elusimicrobiota bacterium]